MDWVGEKAMRLFAAIQIPEEIKSEISARILQKIPGEKFSKTKKENLHVTMLFLGEKSDEEAMHIRKKFDAIRFDAFGMRTGKTGAFGKRVIWLGFSKGGEEASMLAEKICAALEEKSDRFAAHITLARNRSAGQKEFLEVMDAISGESPEMEFEVKSVFLMRSVLTQNGLRYFALSERTCSSKVSGS